MDVNKKIKKQIIEEASSNPEKYFPVETLKKKGFVRQTCKNCQVRFWSTQKRDICGDTNCVGSYSFIGNTPAKNSLEFTDVYLEWRKFIEKRGYMHVTRFPIVARWRDDLDFNIASIIGFQPYVTKGIVAPPSELVSIPQNCLRFGDIDNIGYTGRHGTNFVMIGQCAFKKPSEYDQAKYVTDLLDFLTDVVKIPIDEIQLHEDAWLGGGDCGPSIEFFSRGLELANQVYMWFDMSNATDIKEIVPLKLKVLDMGMGQERVCWFSKGSLNQYEATMPKVCAYLFEKTSLKPNWEIYKKFLPYSGMLNLDEVEDIDKAWKNVVDLMKVNLSVEEVKKEIEPLAGLYSLADHSKTLLYALTDGALPSNVKGGYNLRLVLRRALDFIFKFGWDIDLYDLIVLHAQELSPLYPELKEELAGRKNQNISGVDDYRSSNIKKIIDLEVVKYKNHKEKVENKIKSLVKKGKELSNEDYIKYYISDGITPEEIKENFEKQGIKILIPANFFTMVNEFFESRKLSLNNEIKNKLAEFLRDLPATEILYYEDMNKDEEDVNIIKEFSFEGANYIVLDRTLFYPTMGGQASDKGFIGEKEIIEAIKIGDVIIHKIK